MLYLVILLVIIGIILLWQSTRQRAEAGLPGGRVIYTDTRAWGKVEKPLVDHVFGLTGKPDYLVERDGLIIPVEVKSGRTPSAPYDSHIFQVAAYCLLVEKAYGKRPPYGIIHYPNRDFAVDYTNQLESSLLEQLADGGGIFGQGRHCFNDLGARGLHPAGLAAWRQQHHHLAAKARGHPHRLQQTAAARDQHQQRVAGQARLDALEHLEGQQAGHHQRGEGGIGNQRRRLDHEQGDRTQGRRRNVQGEHRARLAEANLNQAVRRVIGPALED